ncbi:hypothetical protein SDC9_190256 [bioreactor metagenome]|uniref:RNA-binding protein n=1 Tax=bioreactor metagenome TaxID=1076179 RepID=A0A645HWZ5_9ZZZZ|nr:KOW domain-containing RNA-binding protein [Lachnospiraceae bacterium]
MEFFPGQVVYSKCGRDKGRAFIILSFEENYLYLTDGTLRPIERPKKKKVMHVQKTGFVFSELGEKIINGETITNSEIEKALKNVAANI